MAVTKVTYTDAGQIATTGAIDDRAAGGWASSAIFDNTSGLYVDVQIGGHMATTATTVAVGDTFEIYIAAAFDLTAATDLGGGIGTALAAGSDLTADTGFVAANLIHMDSVSVKSASPDAAYNLLFGPIGVAQCFGGHMPQNFLIVVHNNTGSAAGTCKINAVGITYTST